MKPPESTISYVDVGLSLILLAKIRTLAFRFVGDIVATIKIYTRDYKECNVCGQELAIDEQDLDGMCSYHAHALSKDD